MLNQTAFGDILKSLIRTPAVVSAEHSFFRVLQRELEERGARVTWYEGLLVAQGSEPDSLMLSAHIDRHGLICTGPNEFQYAAFVAGGRSNLIFELSDMAHLVAGTPVAFRDKLVTEDGRFSGQLDNVLTAAMLVYLFELGFTGTAFFTAQEEAGRSWRYLLEWFRRFGGSTNQLVVVDTSPYPDTEAADKQQLVLRHSDANASFNKELTGKLAKLCHDLGISYSFKDEYIREQNRQLAADGHAPKSLGSTEMGRIISASHGLVDGTTLQIPTTGYHTMNESAALNSCEAFLQVLCAVSGLQYPLSHYEPMA